MQLTVSLQYYKPWQFRPGDEETLREQIEEAEAIVAREVAEFEARYSAQEEETSKKQDDVNQEENHEQASPVPEAESKKPKGTSHETSDTVSAETVATKNPEATQTDATPSNDNNVSINNDHADVHRGAEDDGGEVVEDQEDTVIY
jgi:hypothetical protein